MEYTSNCKCNDLRVETVAIKKLHEDSQIPVYKHVTDAGCDLFSYEDVVIPKGSIKLIGTGVAIKLPNFYEAQIRPRSGLAVKHGITVINSPGTIDCDYTGEIKVGLVNLGKDDYTITKGDRIAQMIVSPVTYASFVEVDSLVNTERGDGGFGSTDKK